MPFLALWRADPQLTAPGHQQEPVQTVKKCVFSSHLPPKKRHFLGYSAPPFLIPAQIRG